MNEDKKKIEGEVPVTAIGIENIKESYPDTMSAHRRLYPWFAIRPTSATRLAILGSILGDNVTNDELLRMIGVRPAKDDMDGMSEEIDTVEEYVIEKNKGDSDSQSVEDWYGYEYPNQQNPTKKQLESIKSEIEDQWGKKRLNILDATSGSGTIPLESLRYDMNTFANELNPVAWLINKVILDYAKNVGRVNEELQYWVEKISDEAYEEMSELYPDRGGIEPSIYLNFHTMPCPSCGCRFPLAESWYFNRRRDIYVQPIYDEDSGEYELKLRRSACEDFDPNDGTVSNGEAICPYCNASVTSDDISESANSGEFGYEIGAVRYESDIGETEYYKPNKDEEQALKTSIQEYNENLEYMTLLDEDIGKGKETERLYKYGMNEWRDVFFPRQFISYATLLEKFRDNKDKIREKYDEDKSEAIITMVSMVITKTVNRNTKLQPIDRSYANPANILGDNNLSKSFAFGETNIFSGAYSIESTLENFIEYYNRVVRYLRDREDADSTVMNNDAESLPIPDGKIDSVVIDPPYGDNVMYAELSDLLYVWLKEFIGDVFPDEFSREETNKHDEAVENPSIAPEIEDKSKTEIARDRYMNKMTRIFDECSRVLDDDGIMTVYFTDRDIEAWNSLINSIIDAGFAITATNLVTSEAPQRVGMQGNASADSTILITCRKHDIDGNDPSLITDVLDEFQRTAEERAQSLMESDTKYTKTDIIIGSYGPVLESYVENYPIVGEDDEIIEPSEALETARNTAVDTFIRVSDIPDSFESLGGLTRWYIMCWFVYNSIKVPYDEGLQMARGTGADINSAKRKTKIWSKTSGDIKLAQSGDRVQDIDDLDRNADISKRKYPVDPRSKNFARTIDAVHSAIHIYRKRGDARTENWLRERELREDKNFKDSLRAIAEELPSNYEDVKAAENMTAGKTGDYLFEDEHNTF